VDNIQKSILGVLGIAAILTMMVPDGSNLASSPAAAPAPPPSVGTPASAVPTPQQPAEGAEEPNNEFAMEGTELEEGDELANFGQPMNDARPFGQPANNAPNVAAPPQPQGPAPTQAYAAPAPAFSGATQGQVSGPPPVSAPVQNGY
jgi:hypothetical protein